MTAGPIARSVRAVDRRRRDLLIDLGLCAAITAYALPPMLDRTVNDPRATLFGPLLAATFLVPVFLRRRAPLAAAAAFAIACVVSGVPTFHQFRLVVAVPVAVLVLLSLAMNSTWPAAVAGLAGVVAGLLFVGATDSVIHGASGVAGMAAAAVPLCLAIWGAGRIAWSRDRVAVELRERSEQLRRQREATAALAVDVDRARLAGELDLAVRARLQEIIALASAGPAGPPGIHARFGRIEVLGRESLDQMRGLLGRLRSVDRGARAPRPTLEQLDGLLADARAGGRIVDLEVEGEHRALAAIVELAAFRTVQHALLAVDRRATVLVRYLPDTLELEIRGPSRPGSAAGAALAAARERVLALGGTFAIDPPSTEPRVLRARLPAVPAHA
jgi:signal transduction histidine kinase